jgi:hypothetical protein
MEKSPNNLFTFYGERGCWCASVHAFMLTRDALVLLQVDIESNALTLRVHHEEHNLDGEEGDEVDKQETKKGKKHKASDLGPTWNCAERLKRRSFLETQGSPAQACRHLCRPCILHRRRFDNPNSEETPCEHQYEAHCQLSCPLTAMPMFGCMCMR